MTPTRRFIIIFWVFIGGMLLWQFYNYNKGIDEDQVAHPQQEHFFFNSTNATPGPVAPVPAHDGANVQQVAFTVSPHTPGAGSFTCHVTLKNTGNAKADSIQVMVRPYRGITMGDEDVGHSNLKPIDDGDPLAQYGSWLGFPDLAPGESSTQTVVFTARANVPFGGNSNPEITFESEKKK